MRFKNVLAVLLILLASGSMIFATGQSEAEDEQITLRFSWWGGEERHNAILDAIALYEQKNPNVTIEPEFGGWSGYIDKLATQAAAGQQPDVFYSGTDGPWTALPDDMRVDLNQYDVDGRLTGNLPALQVKQAEIGGKLMGLPRQSAGRGYLINKTILDELGLEVPSFDWTWDDFAALSQQVYDLSGGEVYGALDETGGVTYRSFGGRAFMLATYGKPLLTADGIELSRDELIDYYSWWKKLRDSGAVSSAAVSVAADANQNSPIVLGQVAMLPIAGGSIGQFLSNTPDTMAFVPFPQGEYPCDEVNAGVSLSVSAASKNIDAAIDFADYMINDVESGMILGTSMGIPTNSERRAALLASQLDEGSKMGFAHFQYLSESRELMERTSSNPAEGEFDTRRFAEEQRLAFGKATVEQTVDAILKIARDLGIPTR